MTDKTEGLELRHGGRTLEVRVYVNTDEAPDVVLKRVEAAAKGEKGEHTASAVNECDLGAAKKLWEFIFTEMRKRAGEGP